MKPFLKAYLLPIAAIAAYVGIGILWHGRDYGRALLGALERPAWWAENTLSVILFTALVSVVVNIAARQRQAQERAPFEGWQVRVRSGGGERAVPLNWREVRRFKDSPLEERRFIQSVLSAQGERVKLEGLDLVQDCDWVERDDEARDYVIDLVKFRAGKRENADSGSEIGASY